MSESINMAPVSLEANPHIQELFAILQSSGRDTEGLSALLGHVSEMESFVRRAEDTISDMKVQLSEMKEVQSHPVKTALQNTIKTLERKVAEVKAQLSELKGSIIEGCKSAVAAFREKGITALDKLASFFHVKDGLQDWSKSISVIVRHDDKAVAQIVAFADEYHSAGRAVKNMARVAVGKEPLDTKKEAGKLAKALAAPYKAQKKALLGLQQSLAKAIDGLEQLESRAKPQEVEQDAPAKQQARVTVKPSLMAKLNENRERVAREKRELPVPERAKVQGLEV